MTVTVTVVVENKDKQEQDIITLSFSDEQHTAPTEEDESLSQVTIVKEESNRGLKITADDDLNISIDIGDAAELVGDKKGQAKNVIVMKSAQEGESQPMEVTLDEGETIRKVTTVEGTTTVEDGIVSFKEVTKVVTLEGEQMISEEVKEATKTTSEDKSGDKSTVPVDTQEGPNKKPSTKSKQDSPKNKTRDLPNGHDLETLTDAGLVSEKRTVKVVEEEITVEDGVKLVKETTKVTQFEDNEIVSENVQEISKSEPMEEVAPEVVDEDMLKFYPKAYLQQQQEEIQDTKPKQDKAKKKLSKEKTVIEEVIYASVDVDDEAFGEIAIEEVPQSQTVPLPEFDILPNPSIVKEGQLIKLACRVSGEKPDITWLKGSKVLSAKEERINVEYDDVKDLHVLTIDGAKPEDAGEFSVQAKNPGGTVSAFVNVAIVVPEMKKVVVEEDVVDTKEKKVEQTPDVTEKPSEPEDKAKVKDDKKKNKKEEKPKAKEEEMKQEKAPETKEKPKEKKKKSKETDSKSEEEEPKAEEKEKPKKKDKKKDKDDKKTESPGEESDKQEEKQKKDKSKKDDKSKEKPKQKEDAPQEETNKKDEKKPVDEVITESKEPVQEEPPKEPEQTQEPQKPKEEKKKPDEAKKDEAKPEEVKQEEPKPEKVEQKDVKPVEVPKGPKFLEEPKPVTAGEGEKFRLQCKIEGDVQVTWSKDGKKIKPKKKTDKKYKVDWDINEDVYFLEVSELSTEDSGEYTVSAKDAEGTTTCKVKVDIEKKKVAPIIRGSLQPVAVEEGESFKLSCVVEGCPEPEVVWSKNGEPIKAKDSHYKVSSKEGTFTLKVKESVAEDSACYTVKATNSSGSIDQGVTVTVKAKPKPEAAPVEETIQQQEAVVAETAPREEDKPKLKAPEFVAGPDSLTVKEYEELRIVVTIKGSDDMNVSWFQNGKPVKAQDRIKMLQDGDSHVLSIPKCLAKDAGEYTCTAKNQAGESFCSVAVNVEASELKDAEDEIQRELMEQLSPKIKEEQERVTETDMEMLLKEFPMLGPFTDQEKSVQLNEGDVVEVLDTEKDTEWLVRKQNAKEKVCYVPVELLLGKKKEEEKAEPAVDEESSAEEEETPEVQEDYPVFTAITEYVPPDTAKDHLSLKEGDQVEVLDSSSPDRWWCRRPSNPKVQGWVPPGYLQAQVEEKVDSRSTQEVFREDVLKVSNKEQEAVLKRRYALKDLWESERLYIDDLKYAIDTYHGPLGGNTTPDILKDKRDMIFSTLPDVLDFHHSTFLDALIQCANDAASIGDAFLAHRENFQKYVLYFKDRNLVNYLLALEDPAKFIKELDKTKGNVGKKKQSLAAYLARPWSRIDEYVNLLKDFIRYTAHANQDYSRLEEAVEMLLDLKKQADDMVTLSRIEGYPEDITQLGPIFRHDDFTVWDGKAVGKGRERHLFLFKETLMLTKKKKPAKSGDPPSYEFKGLIDLPKTLLNEELEDPKTFELWFEDLTRGLFTFQAKSVPIKITWCDLLRQWLKKWGAKPEFKTSLEKLSVRENDPAKFSCRVEGQPIPEVSWLFNDQPLKSGPKYRIVSDVCEFSITIPQTKPDMTGTYKVVAKNNYGEETRSAELVVKEIINKPEFSADLSNAEVLLGASARFDCKVSGKPAPEIKWYKNGEEVTPSSRHKFLFPDDDSFSLLISKVEEADMGEYECRASNKGGADSRKAKLVITDLEERKKEHVPEFTSNLSDSLAIEGIQTKMSCRLIGYPAPEVSWFFDGKEIKRGDYYDLKFDGTECTLIIRIVHEEHAGKYTCRIKNKFGTSETSAELKVATRPMFKLRFSNQEIFKNETAEFVCQYNGYPPPDVTWLYEKHAVPDSERIKIVTTDTESKMTINLAMVMDEGEYGCKISNQAGEATCSAMLFVLKDVVKHGEGKSSQDYEVSYAPTLVKKLSNQEAIIGAPLKLACKALGEPAPTAKWLKDGKPVAESERVIIDQVDNLFRLVLRHVMAEDAGEYSCTISNKAGDVTTSAQVLTEEPKETVAEEHEIKVELQNLPPRMTVHKPDLFDINVETIKLTWQAAQLPRNAKPSPIKYAVDRKDITKVRSDWDQVESGIEALSAELKGFDPSKDYLYRVRATNEYGTSEPSMAVTYYGKAVHEVKKEKQKQQEDKDAQAPPVDLKKEPLPPKGPRSKPDVEEVGDDMLKISWQAGELPSHAVQTDIFYIVERRNPPSKTWVEIAGDLSELSYVMKSYKPEKDYMFRIRASNDYGISDPSMSATMFAKPEASKKPAEAKKDQYKSKVKPRTIWDKPEISELTDKTLTLRWKPSAVPSYAQQTPIWYIVEQREPPNLEWIKISEDEKDTEKKGVKINRKKDYYWRIKAANEFGVSEPSMPVMLRKVEEVEEVKEDFNRQRRRSRSYSREPQDRGVPEHMRIPPEFVAPADDTQYGVEGRTMKICSSLKAFPKPEISWYVYGRRLDVSDRLACTLSDKGELVLEIQNFCWSDIGEYKVEARNEFGTASQCIKVDMADPPTFLEPFRDQVFHLRGNGKLECRVHGIPYPTVTFKRDWRAVADSHRVKIVREEYDHWTLNFTNAIHMDEGLYECVAENIAGKVYCSANVKVSEKHGMFRDIKFNPCPVEDYFHVIDEIGRGSYGVVRRVIDKNSGNQYAAKVLRYGDPVVKEELMTELEILSLLDHQNVIQVVDGYEDKKRLIIIMEIVTGGELVQRLIKDDALTESEVAFYLRQLLTAVEYLHSKNVIHLDLKPENLLLLSPSSEELKIIDFSFARKYNPTRRLYAKYGTPEFVSPEVVYEEPVTPAADIWSVGVIAYVLLSGLSPFKRDSIRDTLLAVRAGVWSFDEEAFSNISKDAKDFISKLLVKDPRKRLTATEALDHSFINLAHHRGLGDRIAMDRHKGYIFKRKVERGMNLVRTIVKPVAVASHLVEKPPEFEFELDEAPALHLPGSGGGHEMTPPLHDRDSHISEQELGAAGMLSIMGPPSMASAAPSTVGSGDGSSEWGREYEDEDTWYDFSSAYQSGVDAQLLPSKDTRLGVRMAKYRRSAAGGSVDEKAADTMKQSSFRPRPRPSMKERQDLRDIEKEREMELPGATSVITSDDVLDQKHMSRTRRGLWQVRRMMDADKSSEGFPPIFKEKIKDKAYNVGDSCTLHVHVIGKPNPVVSWYRNEELLSTGGRVRVTNSEEGLHSLTVLQTKPNDFGVYKCVSRNKYGTVTCRARMLCGDHPSRPGRPHVTKVSDNEAFMIWEEPESDGNSHIQAYKLDWFKTGDTRWTAATYCIDECALIKGLKPDTSYRFRVCAVNAFGQSPYSWASVEVRTKKKGATPIEIEAETKRILLRSRQATNRPSPESSPVTSRRGSVCEGTPTVTEETLDAKAKDHGVLDREIHLQEIEPERFLTFGSDVWRGRFTLIKNVKPLEGKKVKRVAKILCYDEKNPDESLREYEMLKSVRQQHIVRLHEAFHHGGFVYLVFEKLYGENVARSLSLKNKYNEHHVSAIIKQVLDAMQFLHHRGIVHLNLQPDNVIMVSRRRFDVKLIDFGRARKISSYDGEKLPYRDGTAEFMAPEKVARELVGVAADIWGVGVLTFILLSGVSPFEGEIDEDVYANITQVRYDAHSLYHNVTKYALKFIYQILKRSPKARLTTEEALDHRWLMLNAPMIKVRKAAVFPTDKLRAFEESYIKRRLAGCSPPERLTKAYGIGMSFSSDEEDDIFSASSRY